MKMMSLYERVGEYAVREIAGETILVPIRSSVVDLESVFILNGTASVVWNLLDVAPTIDAFVEAVALAFEVTASEAREDVLEFLTSLEEAKVIRRRAT